VYLLYWAPATGSLAVQAILEETGTPYQMRRVDLEAGDHHAAAYLRINPNGLVPALVDADGRAYFESAALVMLLCDRHPEAGLAPPVSDARRGRYYQWLLYMADTIYPAYGRWFHGERYSTEPDDALRVREKARLDLLAKWRIVDQVLTERPYLLGEHFSACDVYLLMLATWFEPFEQLLNGCPGVARCAQATAARPAVARALATHQQADALTQLKPR
jgi:glutathione S-transferase